MPLIHYRQINFNTKIGVWHITEAENFFLKKINLQQNITHPHKRLQHLAGRYLLLQLFPNFPLSLIQIAHTKKPFLKDDAFHFSISHCGHYAAVIVSTQHRVGVDIEIPQQKIATIQHKFLGDDEHIVINNFNEHTLANLTMAWSTKEAIFKWYGLGKVDFKKDMIIKSIKIIRGVNIVTCEFLKQPQLDLDISNVKIMDVNLTWLIKDV